MKHLVRSLLALSLIPASLLAACAPAASTPSPEPSASTPGVLAVETFLAEIAQNVAGDRLHVAALIPIGVDPHTFEPTPADIRKVAGSQVLIANGAGFEGFLERLLRNAGGERLVIEASAGLASRTPREGEHACEDEAEHEHEGDPHFWLDPISIIRYVENIRDGLSQADPAGREVYATNADVYIGRLRELDAWIREQVMQIPGARRQLVTNHETLGYFADRYGFRIVGTVIPGVSTNASPSARELARLIDRLRAEHAPVIFLETGANRQLASQLAGEVGIDVVAGLHTHSVTKPGGDAPTYIDMMRYNVGKIVEALK